MLGIYQLKSCFFKGPCVCRSWIFPSSHCRRSHHLKVERCPQGQSQPGLWLPWKSSRLGHHADHAVICNAGRSRPAGSELEEPINWKFLGWKYIIKKYVKWVQKMFHFRRQSVHSLHLTKQNVTKHGYSGNVNSAEHNRYEMETTKEIAQKRVGVYCSLEFSICKELPKQRWLMWVKPPSRTMQLSSCSG